MRFYSFLAKDKCLKHQSVCLSKHAEPWHKTGLALSLLGALLIGGLAAPDWAIAGDRGTNDRYSESYGRQDNHYKKHHKHSDSHRYYRPYYRPYYPWGLGLGVGLATGWNLGYGWNDGIWNDDWRWNRERYWHSPYSGIGLSIPTGYDDTPVAISAPVRVTTSMQYSPSEGRMVSNMPTNSATVISQTGTSTASASTASAEQIANVPRARAARSVSSLPSNARIVQQDGRTLYEWQGTLYAFDWNSQTYQEQLVK
ncbi:hypothetical protein [Shewanella sp. LZH-2]|uniref:hypothetical protein n=1 Tax=Shewanella TaxID=22 RepID=UPI00193E7A04|nr:hypothetical protein [Shewanella sp. LZH-2]QRK79156.1 hypothetical protein JM642_18110 [Shewanella sp. LZH-2]